MKTNLVLTILLVIKVSVCNGIASNNVKINVTNYPFDKKLYEDVLDPELCQRQLEYLTGNNSGLMFRFQDASARLPRGILQGNLVDLGNYHQCLAINEGAENMNIKGKYCMSRVIEDDNSEMLNFLSEWSYFDINDMQVVDKVRVDRVEEYLKLERSFRSIFGMPERNIRVGADNPLSLIQSGFGMCIPASCTPQEALSAFFFNFTGTGISVNADFCRLPNDKPWVPADYVAIVLFSTIGLLVILSTIYDVWLTLLLKKDSKDVSILYRSFSIYTNGRRLLTFNSGPNSLHCIDGIRALAMFWVIAGHTIFCIAYCINRIDGFQWVISKKAFWITSAPITVDTFFMLSGLLVVYTTAGKLNNVQLIRNLPLFYLSRLLRMFPVLAAMILYLVSFHNRIADGPNWNTPAFSVLTCRQYWWSALLHIQNWYNPKATCLPETWYLSVDVQLHILSPIVLFWVLTGRKLWAWTALTLGLLTSLAAATAFNFVKNFQSGSISQNAEEVEKYQMYYYTNTLTRASPFFVGMIFGYILHLWKGRPLQINKIIIYITWLCALSLLGFVVYCARLNLDQDWDNQLVDNLLNSFMRPAWAMGLGWVIVACVKGHGGPINWLLCLDVWKLPARLSYAMYLIHLTVISTKYSAASLQIYFSVENLIFDITTFLIITMMIAFLVTLTIDAPFTTLTKLFLFKDLTPKTQNTAAIKEVSDTGDNPNVTDQEDETTSKKL